MIAVLISIHPEWCRLIANLIKVFEIRKTKPKIKPPFKCYIYCTNGKGLNDVIMTHDRCHVLNGKVIGEFTCDKIVDIYPEYGYLDAACVGGSGYILDKCGLTRRDLINYGKGKILYGWHISELQIYDKPKELGEFWAHNDELHKRYDAEENFCCYDGTDLNGEPTTDCGDACNNITNCYRCWEEWSGWCHRVERPPQSWCYVEAQV